MVNAEVDTAKLTKKGRSIIYIVDRYLDYYQKSRQGSAPPICTLSDDQYGEVLKAFKDLKKKPDKIYRNGVELRCQGALS